MAELTAAFSNPGGADAAVMAVMASNPTCGGCLTKCASAADATSCAMGCTTAASVALPAAGGCSFDKFTMLRAAGAVMENAMKVLDTISATDPACGGCLKSIAVAALADPSVLMACANSDAKSQLQAVLGGGSQPSGARARGARLCARAHLAWCAGGSGSGAAGGSLKSCVQTIGPDIPPMPMPVRPYHVCTGTGLAPSTSAPELGSPLATPAFEAKAHRRPICTGT